jgi:hypothetical protein
MVKVVFPCPFVSNASLYSNSILFLMHMSFDYSAFPLLSPAESKRFLLKNQASRKMLKMRMKNICPHQNEYSEVHNYDIIPKGEFLFI